MAKRHFHTDKPKADQPRHTCFYCKTKRYEDRMERVFSHPILTNKNPVWACKYQFTGDSKETCVVKVMRELLLYQETGLLHIAKQQTTK